MSVNFADAALPWASTYNVHRHAGFNALTRQLKGQLWESRNPDLIKYLYDNSDDITLHELDRQQCVGASGGQQLAPVVGSSRWRHWRAAAAGASSGPQLLMPVVGIICWNQWRAAAAGASGEQPLAPIVGSSRWRQ